MAENSFFQRIKNLKVDLKPMTIGQKIEHIWTYFKEVILITVISLIVVIGTLTTMLKPEKELLMGGMCVNTYFSEEGTQFLQQGYFQKLQGNEKEQEVQLYFRSFNDFTENTSVQDYEAFQAMTMLLTAGKVDYLFLNEYSLGPIISGEALLDLRQIFTTEELEQFGTKIRYAQGADEEGNPVGEKYPVALEITELPFVQDCRLYEQKIFLAFSNKAPNQDDLRDLWEYLQSWEAKPKV